MMHYITLLVLLLCILIVISIFLNKRKDIYSEFHVVVISLARRKDRLLEFKNNYKLDIGYDVVNAVDGKQLDIKKLMSQGIIDQTGLEGIKNKKSIEDLGSTGAIGCYLSHFNVWKAIKSPYTIVFEDDALVNIPLMSEIRKRINDLPKDWHIYIIGQIHTIFEATYIASDRSLLKLKRFCGTHAYIISELGAKWLLKHGSLFPINKQIDAKLSSLTNEGLNIYIHDNYPLISFAGTSTDIQVF